MVLQSLIIQLQRSLRDIDSIGRLGGEEFLIVLPETSPERAVMTAERIRNYIEKTICAYVNEKEIKITISIGISIYKPDEFDHQKSQNRPQEYVRQSDLAMYKAKSSGRNCVVLWEPGINSIETV